MTLDHDVQNKSEANLKKYEKIENFAKSQGVDFYPAGRGIGHQIMIEEGYAWPGTLAVASDSHSNMYGGVGCLGTPVVRTDAAAIWSTTKTWWSIPPVAKVNFTGQLQPGVQGKDVIVALCGLFSKDEVLNHAIEFTGSEETMRSLSVDDRLTIANMTTEWGALSGLFPIDGLLQSWLRAKATEYALYEPSTATRFNHQRLDELFENPMSADKDAKYAKYLTLNLDTVPHYVSGPNSVKIATPLAELHQKEIPIQRAYLVSCTNSRRSDIHDAANVIRERAAANGGVTPKIGKDVKFYIAAASLPEQKAAEEQGDWQLLLEAGAEALPSGCGPCIGLGTGLLEPGMNGISASNRNFKGRMGSPDAKAYLASPAVVTASALAGRITGPGDYAPPAEPTAVEYSEGEPFVEKTVDETLEALIGKLDSIIEAGPAANKAEAPSDKKEQLTEILPGFPEKISGQIVFCSADNISTDAVYPGKYTVSSPPSPSRSPYLITLTVPRRRDHREDGRSLHEQLRSHLQHPRPIRRHPRDRFRLRLRLLARTGRDLHPRQRHQPDRRRLLQRHLLAQQHQQRVDASRSPETGGKVARGVWRRRRGSVDEADGLDARVGCCEE
jgi:homoaconitate hydratase